MDYGQTVSHKGFATSTYQTGCLSSKNMDNDELTDTTSRDFFISLWMDDGARKEIHGYIVYRIQSFINKAIRSEFCQVGVVFEELAERANQKLFKLIQNEPFHILHSLIPPKSTQGYNLRSRAHQLAMPVKSSHLDNKNFVTRMLFNFSG